MDLQAWLKHTNTRVKDFAGRIGVDQATVRRYMNGTRKPSLDTMKRIADETKGSVGIESFYGDRQSAA